MLGKQWMNRYASIDMRGSAIERSQNCQRKLDGIVGWYFDHVMESLPLMLQIALLLLGCGLSRYLWEIDTTVASVVLGATSFGVLLYLFIVFAGVISNSCPYQTPTANVIRSVLGVIRRVLGVVRRVPGLLRSAYALFVEHSALYYVFVVYWRYIGWRSPAEIIMKILAYPLALLKAFATNGFRLGRAILRTLVVPARRARSWLFGISSAQDQVFYDQATKLDFRCVLWMLGKTSLNNTVKMSILDFFGTILPLSGLNSSATSAMAVDCFNILTGFFVTGGIGRVTIAHGSEQLAEISAVCFLRAFSCLLSTEPTSAVI
ncbi:hypothetical protein BDM02DRAFT_1228532 [Thelephora ganbajun]|uniref:Uncharacterized protein n=1 Tax=Thelephora ganbajun TaxID=370292 RepID=A0ACB6Z3J3_THEGA|nr:hypothetical protein BDM02DRAFT_1228532 [Thelephora ganbajun]